MIDDAIFFDAIRKPLAGGKLHAYQVEGFELMLDEYRRLGWTDLRWLAYVMATAWHETATRMQPVMETRRADEPYNPTVDTAIQRLESSWKKGSMPWVKTAYWRKDKNGHSWLGRGYPQCTHRVNYEKCEKATGHPFTAQPHLMLEATPAIQAMFSMMQSGGYTGKSLAHYFNSKANDPHNARRIINATESADKIKGYYTTILNALTKASKG